MKIFSCFVAVIFIPIAVSSEPATTMTVSSVLIDPYLKRIRGNENTTNPEDYEGFTKDLLDEVAKLLNISYSINISPMFGGQLENGTWTGVFGDLSNEGLDLAAGPLTVTSHRRKAFEFSIPFQNFGPVIVMKKPSHTQPTLGERVSRLFAPLEQGVWLMSLLAYFAVSSIVYVICHCNPYEWRRMAKDGEATLREAESFNCTNSFWFVFSTWVWQGYTRTPRSLGGRLVVMFWWIYVVMFLVTFTASLTNLLRLGPVPREVESFTRIRSLDDLTKQSSIDYGMLRNGATEEYFKNAQVPYLKHVWNTVSKSGEHFTDSVEEGISRVRHSWRKEYAFVMESAMAKFYSRQEPCDLYYVGDFSISGSYSFAFMPGWEMAKDLDLILMMLRENGILHLVEEKWFAGKCEGYMINPSQNELLRLPPFYKVDLGSFSGALIVLLLGVVAGGIATVIEVLIYRKVELQPEVREHLHPTESADNALSASSPEPTQSVTKV